MLHMFELNPNNDLMDPQPIINNFISDASFTITSSYYTMLKATPGAAIFSRDMLFDIILSLIEKK